MTEHAPRKQLINELRHIVGSSYLLTSPAKMEAYCKGFRFGQGEAYAVVRPATLLQMWQVLQACVKADVIVIMQAANTGLTGGSTPNGNDYDRPVVIINTMRIDAIQPIDTSDYWFGW